MAGLRDPELERTIRTDLLDFVTVWADLSVRLAPIGEADRARREALQRLDEAEALLGPSVSLDRLRRDLCAALGMPGPPPSPASAGPQSAWEHCDLGRSYLRSGDLRRAAGEFERALELRPQDFWPNFYRGLCAYHLGRFDDAVNAFSICVALAPEAAECYFNRASAREALGQADLARRDYGRALELDRSLTEAALNRGILNYSEGRYGEADSDLDRAQATASGRETLGLIHYHRALVGLARGDRPSAIASLEAAMGHGHEEARKLYKSLRP
jgi:tetratricopeptide (TPR) repeat protein